MSWKDKLKSLRNETKMKVRQDYANGVVVDEIAAKYDIHRVTVYDWINGDSALMKLHKENQQGKPGPRPANINN